MAVEARRQPLETMADAAARVAATSDLRVALAAIAEAAAEALEADLVVVRLQDVDGTLVARAVAPEASALAAEVAGSRATGSGAPGTELAEPTRRAAERARA